MIRDYKDFAGLADCWLSSQSHLTEHSRDRYGFAIGKLKLYFSTLNGGLDAAVERWNISRRSAVSPATWNLELGIASQIFAYGVSHGKPNKNSGGGSKSQEF